VIHKERPVDPTRSTGRSCNRHPLPTGAPEVTLEMSNLALSSGGTIPFNGRQAVVVWGTGTPATLLTTRSTGVEPGLIRS
jgi:hypothetical protein